MYVTVSLKIEIDASASLGDDDGRLCDILVAAWERS